MSTRILYLFGALLASCVHADGYRYRGHDYVQTPLGNAIDKASMRMLKEAYSAAADKNVVSSPLGVLMLLSMYSAGAGEGARQEIVRALGTANYTELYNSYTKLSEKFSAMDSSYLTLANKVYVDNGCQLDDRFVATATHAYRSEVEAVDFRDPKATAAIINRWADLKTKGYIKDPVDPDALKVSPSKGLSIAALVNVIFFQGHWSVQFNANETVEKDFYIDKTTTVKKPTLILPESTPLFHKESPEIGARMVELPYKENGFRMIVVLPDEVDGLAKVVEKVAERGLLDDVFAMHPTREQVAFEMPKFEINTSLDLNELLPKFGVSKIFHEPALGILKDGPVKVSKAFQKAFVKVDEEGATAGAFTGVILVLVSDPPPPPTTYEFKVDRPFLFAILHEDTVLFAGTYSH